MITLTFDFETQDELQQFMTDVQKGRNVSDVDERIRMQLKHAEMSDEMAEFLTALRSALNE